MNTINYPERRAFTKFDDRHHVLYLGEKPVKYTPEHVGLHDGEAAEAAGPVDGYSYTGPMGDGGTLVAATEATYGAFVSGLLRQKYSSDDVEALQANMTEALHNSEHPRAAEFTGAWDNFQAYREECKAIVKEVINREATL
jgi:hypothetical protein